jgi:hypothetical protein
VNIGRTRFHRVVDDGVDQLDDRRHVRIRRETIQVEYFLALLCFFDKRDLESGRSFLEDSLGRVTFL